MNDQLVNVMSYFTRHALKRCVALLITGVLMMLDVGQIQALTAPDTYGNRGRMGMKKVSFQQLPGWKRDDHAAAFRAFLRSCKSVVGKSPTARKRSSTLLSEVCRKASLMGGRISQSEARKFFERHFTPYKVVSPKPTGLLTGYYEPLLNGSRKPDKRFNIPILRRPDDLVNLVGETLRGSSGVKLTHARKTDKGLVPYYTRAEIERGALKSKGLEILYLDDPVDAFFLHVQGSGRIRLRDGTKIRIGYDGKNGYRYTSIGGVLVEKGEVSWDNLTLSSLRKWLERDPEQAKQILWQNKSYIFFREHGSAKKLSGPLGASEIPLTTGRSLAVDAGYHALGVPIYVTSPSLRHGGGSGSGGFKRLMIAQDVGSAIKGAVRGDIYFGSGKKAGALAGRTKHSGTFTVLLPTLR